MRRRPPARRSVRRSETARPSRSARCARPRTARTSSGVLFVRERCVATTRRRFGPAERRMASADCALERWPRPPEMRRLSGQVYGPSRSMSSSWFISSMSVVASRRKSTKLRLGPSEVRRDHQPGVLRLEGVGHRLGRVVRRAERPEPELPQPALAPRNDPDEGREEISFEADAPRRCRRSRRAGSPSAR